MSEIHFGGDLQIPDFASSAKIHPSIDRAENITAEDDQWSTNLFSPKTKKKKLLCHGRRTMHRRAVFLGRSFNSFFIVILIIFLLNDLQNVNSLHFFPFIHIRPDRKVSLKKVNPAHSDYKPLNFCKYNFVVIV